MPTKQFSTSPSGTPLPDHFWKPRVCPPPPVSIKRELSGPHAPAVPKLCQHSAQERARCPSKIRFGPTVQGGYQCLGTLRKHQLAGFIASQRSFAKMRPSYPSKRTNTHWAPSSCCKNMCATLTETHVHLCSSRNR